MGEIKSTFNLEDIDTLLQAMDDWELLGNQEYHVSQMVKSMPMVDEDHEAFEVMSQIKDHYRRREKDILASRQDRQEQAVFLKAKLMMVRREVKVNQVFDMAAQTESSGQPVPPPVEPQPVAESVAQETVAPGQKLAKRLSAEIAEKLKTAEFFIQDLGVWEHYQKFLEERKQKA